MVRLARRMLVYEWRRFLPAALAVALCGVLLLVQSALILGVFSCASVYVRHSDADLWVGYPGTQSVELGRPISPVAEMRARMDGSVARVERLQWLDGEWRSVGGRGSLAVNVTGTDPGPAGLVFAKAIPMPMRRRLYAPDTFIVDAADLGKLRLGIDGTGEINGHRMRLVGTVRGIRALGAVNIVTSVMTARRLGAPGPGASSTTYLLVKLHKGASPGQVRKRLMNGRPVDRYAVWTSDEFGRRAVMFWLFDTGAGLGFVFAAVVVLVGGATIAGQTLISAVSGSLREYATLLALGVARSELRAVVLEQSAWIGGAGILAAAGIGGLILSIALWQFVPVAITGTMAFACAALVLAVALTSGVRAARSLRNADPAMLLH